MKEKLLEIFQQKDYQPKNYQELSEILNLREDEKEELRKVLNELLDDYEIFLSRKNRYILPKDAHIYKGSISIKNPDYGFITSPDFPKDFYVPKAAMNGAMDKDYVVFSIDPSGNDNGDFKQEAKVIDILERNLRYLVGELQAKKDRLYLETESEQMKAILIVNGEDFREGDIVKAEITDYDKNPMEAKVIEKIGFRNDIGIDVKMIASSFGFPAQFEESTLKELEGISQDTSAEVSARKKPTLSSIITIDGEDAKDLDDAVAIKKLDDGNYLLGVYIADVSYFVKENGAIDREALMRGTSVYLADRVIPMLPTLLSNQLCSLNPNTDKLAIACEMVINDQGEVIDREIFPTVINTKYRMTYTNINKILDGDEEVIVKYRDIYEDVMAMHELKEILNQMRVKRGALDFDIPESKIIVDATGAPVDIRLIERGEGERLIEEFMLIANETVATAIYHLDLPFIYRVHEEPNPLKLESFKMISKTLGYRTLKKKVNPKQLQDFLSDIRDEDSFLKTMLLRSMAKAEYSQNNIGHYGLASSCYTHFTSPIRRYPDLLVHRLLRKYLFNHDINANEMPGLTAVISDIATQTSKKERDAIECEYQVDDLKKAEYMENHIGEVYDGIISSVNRFGLFVELPNLVEGLVHISQLRGRYLYDSKSQSLLGINVNHYRLGDKVQVKVIKSDKKKREIDFKIVYNKDEDTDTEENTEKKPRQSHQPVRDMHRVKSHGERKGRRKK